jgi:hypothetical protein
MSPEFSLPTYGIDVLLAPDWMHQARVGSDRFVVSATARGPGDGTKYPTADLRDAVRIPPNQAALGVRRILPDFSARCVWHEPRLREDARNARSGPADSRGGNPQKTRWQRPSPLRWNEGFAEAISHDGSSNLHGILPIQICSRIGPQQGKNTRLPRTHVASPWKPKEQSGKEHCKEQRLTCSLEINYIHGTGSPTQPRSRFAGCFENAGEVSLLLGSVLQETSEAGRLPPTQDSVGISSIPEITSRFDLAFARPGPRISSHLH